MTPCEHRSITTLTYEDGTVAMWMCAVCRRKFEPLNVPLIEAAQQALAWLQAEQSAADEDCGDPTCDECDQVIRPRQLLIDALREALK